MSQVRAILVLVLLVPMLSGCVSFGDLVGLAKEDLDGSGVDIRATTIVEAPPGEITYTRLEYVRVFGSSTEPFDLEAVAIQGGQEFRESTDAELNPEDGLYHAEVQLDLPEGVVDLVYRARGIDRVTKADLHVDRTPPSVATIARVQSPESFMSYPQILGAELIEARVEGRLQDLSQPPNLRPGDDDVLLIYQDRAGNIQPVDIYFDDGSGLAFGPGFGHAARLQLEAKVFDWQTDTDLLTLQRGAPEYLGEGFGITPNDPVVQAVVDEVVQAGMSPQEIAWELYGWMMANLEYDDSRLNANGLMLPRDVIQDTEGPDQDGDGILDSGPGNGERGAVCRSLAATYVSLVRAAGIPARIVTGYVGGEVQGFHAWVEVMLGWQVWVPVEVSNLDGPRDDTAMLQSFGLQRADMVPLRTLTPEQEQESWSTVSQIQYQFEGSAPTIQFHAVAETLSASYGALCIDVERQRQTISTQDCQGLGEENFLLHQTVLLQWSVEIDDNVQQFTLQQATMEPRPGLITADDGSGWVQDGILSRLEWTE